MTSYITVAHNSETGHRIPGLEGAGSKCCNVHGHSFWIEWTFKVESTDASEGAEFGEIKARLREWVDTHLDHGFACHKDDPIGHMLHEQGLKVLFLDTLPTTEALAELMAEVARTVVPNLNLVRVNILEGRKNQASWEAA